MRRAICIQSTGRAASIGTEIVLFYYRSRTVDICTGIATRAVRALGKMLGITERCVGYTLLNHISWGIELNHRMAICFTLGYLPAIFVVWIRQ